MHKTIGKISSFQSFGTLDGPGIRNVVFMQGCPLRCICCHNPETWQFSGGQEITADELFSKIQRYKKYFASDGGVTVSGGEPLMQADFVTELFKLCKADGINTALDTSGCLLDSSVMKLLEYTDLVLLDHKYSDPESYLKYTKMKLETLEEFLEYLEKIGKPTYLRRVIINGYNDDNASYEHLAGVAKAHSCVLKTELLPFKTLCNEKYKQAGLSFELEGHEQTSEAQLDAVRKKYGVFS